MFIIVIYVHSSMLVLFLYNSVAGFA